MRKFEDEYIAASQASQESLWLRKLNSEVSDKRSHLTIPKFYLPCFRLLYLSKTYHPYFLLHCSPALVIRLGESQLYDSHGGILARRENFNAS